MRNSSRIRNIVELKARQEQEQQQRLQRERQYMQQFEAQEKLTQTCSNQSRTRRRLAQVVAQQT